MTFLRGDSPAASSHIPFSASLGLAGCGQFSHAGRAGDTKGMAEAGEGVRQGRHGMAALGPPSPLSLLDPWIGAPNPGEADGDLLGCRLVTELWPFSGLWLFSPDRREEGFEGLMKAPLPFPPSIPSASSLLTAFGSLSLLARLVLFTALDWFPCGWSRVQMLHQLLHPGLLGVCT